MSNFRVRFASQMEDTVNVEAADFDEAVDIAYEYLPGHICGHCSGWGMEWSRDMGEPEAYSVLNVDTGEEIDLK